ncbi:MAG TPA: amino acid adenylation domain-containing protein, partial [Anaerolineae bacterium]|nr:amino acid adenylation domain-containing protein [Anaerolineae bacterium]
WNNTDTAHDLSISLDSEVGRQASRTPDAIAIEHGDERLTYAQLEQQATQLAQFLRTQGIEDDDRVGICLPRSFDMVIAVLAILKAGATYVPLDPAYPNERLAYMLDTAKVSLVLTITDLIVQLPSERPPTILLDQQTLPTTYTHSLPRPHNPNRLAYIIFTSGSTGQPKGVMLPHRALVNLMQWQRHNFHVNGVSRTLQFASLSFDVHCQEIFSTWWDGGTLVLVDEAIRQDAPQLVQLLAEKAITRIFLPFVALQQIAEIAEQQTELTLSLHDVISAGEQLQITRQIRNLFSQLPDCALHNQYGPSESHVVSAHTLLGQPTDWPALPPIGKPISNTQLYILDKWQQPVPDNTIGNLYIAGANLAQGYIGRPDLTDERFITLFDAPAYITGDQARYRRDGTIEFLGRRDSQVKIRGYRIELGEIEAVLSHHPAVAQAVVVSVATKQAGELTEQRLIAYVVAPESAELTTSLRAYLSQQLPAYMLPAQFIVLDELPRTPSGKIDRRKIAQQPRHFQQDNFVPPRTPLEIALVEIWQDVLAISPISVTATFFELGGYSLLAVRLLMRIQQSLGKEVPLTTLFQHNTVAQLAAYLTQDTLTFTPSPLVTIQAQGELPALFCIHPGAGQIGPYVTMAREMTGNRPIYGLQSIPDSALTSVEAMASSYISAIRTVQPQGKLHLFGWSLGGTIAYEMARQLGPEQVAKLIMLDSYAPSDASQVADAATRLRFFAQDMGIKLDNSTPPNREHILAQIQLAQQLSDTRAITQLYDVFEANYAAMVAYRPQPYAGELILLHGKNSPDLGWERVVNRPIQCHLIDGNHFSFLQPPFLKSTAQKLEQCLQ